MLCFLFSSSFFLFFFFNDTATTEIYTSVHTLSLHDALPFSLEGFAFFTEAIFLGIYLYGWDRIPPVGHWLAGIVVAVSGMLSGVFVVTVNAWMNAPTGFEAVDGRITKIDPIAAMLNPASLQQVTHMALAAYVATAFAVAAVHAFFLLR